VSKKIKALKDLQHDPNNANKGNDRGRKAVDDSLTKYGAGRSIVVDQNGVVIGGNKTLDAAKAAGIDIEVIKTKGEKLVVVQRDDLDLLQDEKARKLAYADNRAGELGLDWDLDQIKADLDAGMILDDLFSLDELGDMGVDLPSVESEEAPEAQIDAAEELQAKWKVQRGDVWQIGEHRLMCGDCSIDDIGISEADMVFTDPPYNINYQGVSDKRDKIKNDHMGRNEFLDFLESTLKGSPDTMYVCCSWQFCDVFMDALKNLNRKTKAFIVWNKVNPAQHLDKYYKQHEIILYHGPFGGEKTLRGDVWEVNRQRNTEHPTMKPVELVSIAIEDNPQASTIYDPFLGSGTTMVAAERLGRKCYGMEIEPKYCAVILERMQQMGLEPELVENNGSQETGE